MAQDNAANSESVVLATGIATPAQFIAAGTTSDATVVKNTSGTVWAVAAWNVNASVRFVKLYDLATTPANTNVPVQTYAVPSVTNGATLVIPVPVGMKFNNGIGFRITNSAAVADNTSCTAGDVVLALQYQ